MGGGTGEKEKVYKGDGTMSGALATTRYQMMVVGATSMPTGIPIWSAVENKTLFSAKQLN